MENANHEIENAYLGLAHMNSVFKILNLLARVSLKTLKNLFQKYICKMKSLNYINGNLDLISHKFDKIFYKIIRTYKFFKFIYFCHFI